MASIARPLRTAALLPFLLVFLVGQAKADTLIEFNASGTFDDGSSLSGTVIIDTTLGVATAADLDVNGVPGFFELNSAAPNSFGVVPDLIKASDSQSYLIRLFARGPIGGGFTAEQLINVGLPVPSLVGYSGGSTSRSGAGLNSGYADGVLPTLIEGFLASGELTAVRELTAVPEPSRVTAVLSSKRLAVMLGGDVTVVATAPGVGSTSFSFMGLRPAAEAALTAPPFASLVDFSHQRRRAK